MQYEKLMNGLNSLDCVIWKYDDTENLKFLSGFDSLFEFFSEEKLNEGKDFCSKIIHSDDRTTLLRCYQNLRTKKSFSEVFRLKNKQNVYKWIKVKGSYVYEHQDTGYFIGQAIEITEQKQAEQKLTTIQKQIMDIINNVPNPIAIHKEEKIAYINPAGLNMLGLNGLDQVIGKNMRDFMSPLNQNEKEEKVKNSTLVASDGKEKEIVSSRFNIIFNNEPHVISFGNDITEQQSVKKRLSNLEFFDELTNLPNNKWFNETLLSYIENKNRQFSIFLIGLNEFKLINSTFGYKMGDKVLQTIAIRLKNELGKNNLFFRIEGDTFSFIAKIKTKEKCVLLAQKITQIISEPIFIKDQEFYLSPSIGIALFPEDGKDIEALNKNSHAALYLAKEKDFYHIQFYDSNIKEEYSRRMELEKGLRKAIANNEMYLVYQPKCSITSNEVIGAEALLRWKHPELGFVSPIEFIPIAEETGLIDIIGEWVLVEACKQISLWKKKDIDLIVSLNISVKQLHKANLVDIVQEALLEANISSSNLELEITESIMQQSENAIHLLYGFKDLGIKISIDDFGTGYSSLSYLKNLPIDILKIDRTFIKDIEFGQKDRAIVKSIVELGHNLQLTVIAEGVETKGQLDYLNEINCNLAQGYYYSPPLEVNEFEDWMTQKNRN
jgi:diguanylate cyclase (GGDEF)-like protein/PAS domain S-box-containing protein